MMYTDLQGKIEAMVGDKVALVTVKGVSWKNYNENFRPTLLEDGTIEFKGNESYGDYLISSPIKFS